MYVTLLQWCELTSFNQYPLKTLFFHVMLCRPVSTFHCLGQNSSRNKFNVYECWVHTRRRSVSSIVVRETFKNITNLCWSRSPKTNFYNYCKTNLQNEIIDNPKISFNKFLKLWLKILCNTKLQKYVINYNENLLLDLSSMVSIVKKPVYTHLKFLLCIRIV